MHRVLRRTLPAQRHHVLGALSALKLQLAVAKRRVGRGLEGDSTDDAASRTTQIEAMAEQQLAAQTALTELRLWDGMTPQRRALADVAAQCADWVRQAAAIAGHRLAEMAPVDATPSPAVQVPAVHYLVLAALFETLDHLKAPSEISVHLQAPASANLPWRVSVQTAARKDDGDLQRAPLTALPPLDTSQAASRAPAGQSTPAIDAEMVTALAVSACHAEGQWQAAQTSDGWHLDLLPAF